MFSIVRGMIFRYDVFYLVPAKLTHLSYFFYMTQFAHFLPIQLSLYEIIYQFATENVFIITQSSRFRKWKNENALDVIRVKQLEFIQRQGKVLTK